LNSFDRLLPVRENCGDQIVVPVVNRALGLSAIFKRGGAPHRRKRAGLGWLAVRSKRFLRIHKILFKAIKTAAIEALEHGWFPVK
jgi:hypothetical protein